MIRAVILLAVVGACLASDRAHYGKGYQPKTNRCFQCEFRPPKTRSYKVPRQESYDVQVPVHSQECHDEQVLAGHKVTKVEKRTYMEFRPAAHGYGDSDGYEQPSYGPAPAPETYSNEEPIYKTVKRCVPKVDYRTDTRYRTVYDTKTETSSYGGFEPCMGPITAYSAKADGVDDWECHSACYTRKDAYGNVARGCYKGEFGVDPNNSAAQTVNGQTYFFCDADYCNGSSMK